MLERKKKRNGKEEREKWEKASNVSCSLQRRDGELREKMQNGLLHHCYSIVPQAHQKNIFYSLAGFW